MSMMMCDGCGRVKDSDFIQFEVVNDENICESCFADPRDCTECADVLNEDGDCENPDCPSYGSPTCGLCGEDLDQDGFHESGDCPKYEE